MPILVDRSRMAAFQECPRLRFLRYHAMGRGLEGTADRHPLTDGAFVHHVVAGVLLEQDPEAVLREALEQYRAQLDGVVSDDTIKLRAYRLETLTRLWIERRLPNVRAEYAVVEVEREHVWQMTEWLHDMVRCDALLRRRDDGALFLQEFKTARAFSASWSGQWAYNSQIIANIQAMEAIRGERIEGVIIEGMLKAAYLTHAWSTPAGDGLALRGHRGWEHVPLVGRVAPHEWIRHPAWTDADRDGLFNPQQARRPPTAELSAWKRSAIAQERIVNDSLLSITDPSDLQDPYLDTVFPKHLHRCEPYGPDHRCEFYQLCHTAAVAADPIGSGYYVGRTPHHTTEQEGAQ